jgi:hypothetical protein
MKEEIGIDPLAHPQNRDCYHVTDTSVKNITITSRIFSKENFVFHTSEA